jgi:hypothetical protein
MSATKKSLNKDLHDCKIDNQKLNSTISKMVNANDCVTIEYSNPTTRRDVKLAKVEAKLDINQDKQIEALKMDLFTCESKKDLRKARIISKNETKQINTTEKEKTKRNFTARLFGSIDKVIRSLTIGQLLAGTGGLLSIFTVLGEKFKPLGMFMSIFTGKSKED